MNVYDAVVIGLRRCSDRRAELVRDWPPTAGLPRPSWFDAIDNPSDPAAGCLASHRAVLSSHRAPLMILEDDAVFSPDFVWPISAPADWEILWLGGQHRDRVFSVGRGSWVRPAGMVRTHAYIVRRPQIVAAALADVPRIDPYIAALPVPQYALTPFTVGQRAGVSTITGHRRTADQYWNFPSDDDQ